MSTGKQANHETSYPAMDIDSSLDETTQEGLQAIDALIREDPALAEKVVTIYSSGSEVADQWLALLSEGEAKRYPFRLTAALGQTASREALRFVSYDDQTEAKIANDNVIKELKARTRSAVTHEARQEAARLVAFSRLSRYAGALATVHSQVTNAPTETKQTAATA